MHLDLILNNESLSLVINLRREFGRDGVMGSWVLDNKTLISLHTLKDVGFFYGPFSNIRPFFLFLVGTLGILFGVGWLPSCLPVIGELLKELGLYLGRLL